MTEQLLQQKTLLAQQLPTLPILDLDHPGAQDPAYRQRRALITQKALTFHQEQQQTISAVEYTPEEQRVWQHVFQKLRPLHQRWACSLYLEARRKLLLDSQQIPQLEELNKRLQETTGFKLEPIHGLVDPKIFLTKLAQKIMLCTQYIRHPSKPEFTPEPDIIHEVQGHVPLFTNPEFVDINKLFGILATKATDVQIKQLANLYWYTIEFGLLQEGTEIKALGAGLLGGITDLTNAMTGRICIKPFTLQEVMNRDFNYSFEQPVFFVLKSLKQLRQELEQYKHEHRL